MGCKPLLVLALTAFAAVSCQLGQGVYALTCTTWRDPSLPNCVELAPNVVTQWSIVNDTITFNHTVESPDVSFLGLGLSESGSMKGADMFIMTGPGPQWALTDRYAEGFVAPDVDPHQDLALRGVYNEPSSGILSVAFSRKLAPCDARDLPIRRGEKLYLLYAYGPEFGYHGANRGSLIVELYPAAAGAATAAAGLPGAARPSLLMGSSSATEPTAPLAATANGSALLNISMSPVEIPAEETTYMYQWFKLPSDK